VIFTLGIDSERMTGNSEVIHCLIKAVVSMGRRNTGSNFTHRSFENLGFFSGVGGTGTEGTFSDFLNRTSAASLVFFKHADFAFVISLHSLTY
jgi:hypothetical protein